MAVSGVLVVDHGLEVVPCDLVVDHGQVVVPCDLEVDHGLEVAYVLVVACDLEVACVLEVAYGLEVGPYGLVEDHVVVDRGDAQLHQLEHHVEVVHEVEHPLEVALGVLVLVLQEQ